MREKDEEGVLKKCPEVGRTVGRGLGQRAGAENADSRGAVGAAGPTEAGRERTLNALVFGGR